MARGNPSSALVRKAVEAKRLEDMTRMVKQVLFLCALATLLALDRHADAQQVSPMLPGLIQKLNEHASVKTREENKSYKIIWDAYLKLTEPPMPIGPEFNLNTIYPKMSQWSAVTGWAESNPGMGEALLKARDKIVFGLPYGTEQLDPNYIKANLTAVMGEKGRLGQYDLPYLRALDTIAAWATAEVYRLMEAGQVQPALDLAVAHLFVARQYCDRDFLEEKLHSVALLSNSLSNLRDVFYMYQDQISAEQFTHLARKEIPFLRPDRNRLFMPEADRVVAEALIEEVFDPRSDRADVDEFASVFAEIQSKDAPLTRFGAAKRWRNIAAIHGSRTASLERLNLIYDDWWRRWRVEEYDDILAFDTQFERTNPIRYAAVIYSVQDVELAFAVRNQLIAEVNGTATAAGLCAYKRALGVYPDQVEKCYTQFMLKRSDADPYDQRLGPFIYFLVTSDASIDTSQGRLWIKADAKQCLLLSLGQDHEDQRGASHSDDGAAPGEDIVLWPPIKSLERQQGLVQ
jgi:hypothetical protein